MIGLIQAIGYAELSKVIPQVLMILLVILSSLNDCFVFKIIASATALWKQDKKKYSIQNYQRKLIARMLIKRIIIRTFK